MCDHKNTRQEIRDVAVLSLHSVLVMDVPVLICENCGVQLPRFFDFGQAIEIATSNSKGMRHVFRMAYQPVSDEARAEWTGVFMSCPQPRAETDCPKCGDPMQPTEHLVNFGDVNKREVIRGVPAFECKTCHVFLHTDDVHRQLQNRRSERFEPDPSKPGVLMLDLDSIPFPGEDQERYRPS